MYHLAVGTGLFSFLNHLELFAVWFLFKLGFFIHPKNFILKSFFMLMSSCEDVERRFFRLSFSPKFLIFIELLHFCLSVIRV